MDKIDSLKSIIKNLKSFEGLSKDEVYEHRKVKFLQIGRGQGFNKSSSLEKGLSYKETVLQKVQSNLNRNKLIYIGMGLIAAVSLIALLF